MDTLLAPTLPPPDCRSEDTSANTALTRKSSDAQTAAPQPLRLRTDHQAAALLLARRKALGVLPRAKHRAFRFSGRAQARPPVWFQRHTCLLYTSPSPRD